MNIIKQYDNPVEYYKVCLRCIGCFLEEDKRLTSTEEHIVSFILTNPQPVEGKLRKVLLKQLKMSTQSLSGHMKRIRDKGWIDYSNKPDTLLSKLNGTLAISIAHGPK